MEVNILVVFVIMTAIIVALSWVNRDCVNGISLTLSILGITLGIIFSQFGFDFKILIALGINIMMGMILKIVMDWNNVYMFITINSLLILLQLIIL